MLGLRISLSIAVAASFMAVPGCIVPVRTKNQTKNVYGSQQQLDIGSLKMGSTKREEVEKNLAGIRVGGNQNFFWGRWEHSKWVVFAAGMSGAEAERTWGVSNLVIKFDQTGLVKNWEIVGDKELGAKLDEVVPGDTELPLDLSSPVQVAVRYLNPGRGATVANPLATLVLRSESFHLTYSPSPAPPSPKTCDLEIARTNVQNFQTERDFGSAHWPDLVATAHFVEPVERHCVHNSHSVSSKEKRLRMILDPKAFMLFRSYVRQTGKRT